MTYSELDKLWMLLREMATTLAYIENVGVEDYTYDAELHCLLVMIKKAREESK